MNEIEHLLEKGRICSDFTRKCMQFFPTSCQSVAERLHILTSAQDLYNHSLPFCRDIHFPTISTKKAAYAGEVRVRELKVELFHLKLEMFYPQGRTRKNFLFNFHMHLTFTKHIFSLLPHYWSFICLFFESTQYYTVKLSQLDFHKRDIFRGILSEKL